MAKFRHRDEVSVAPAVTADAIARLEALLRELAEEGIRGVIFSAQIGDDGGISVTTQELEAPDAGAMRHLEACDLLCLPISALVAFAIRCARRCLPFALPFASTRDDAIRIDSILRKGEEIARGKWEQDVSHFSRLLDILHEFANSFPSSPQDPWILAGAHAANAAFQAGFCAYQAISADGSALTAEAVARCAREVTFEAAIAGAHAAEAVLSSDVVPLTGQAPRCLGTQSFVKAMGVDFRRIVDLKAGDSPHRGEPIDPSEDGPLGPLWPDGVPDWYREGLADQEWDTVSDVQADILARERATRLSPSYEQLKALAQQSPPPQEWFDEESKPF